MIGQEKILKQIDRLVATGFPRFIIIAGSRGSGKKILAEQIAKKIGARIIAVGNKVDNIREVTSLVYTQSEKTLYLFSNVDKMSIAAKNALLKITEETPRESYFIMTLQDEQQMLNTILSRSFLLKMQPYSPDELIEYANAKNYELSSYEEEVIRELCVTPGELDILMRYNIKDFYQFVEKVIENIGIANAANIFKISNSLSFKEDDGKWDVVLFLRAYMTLCKNKIEKSPEVAKMFTECICSTSKSINEMNINGINKAATFDMWIIEQREQLQARD